MVNKKRKGKKVEKWVELVVEAAFKGATKAFIEQTSGSVLKS